jgi:hypothetical protein
MNIDLTPDELRLLASAYQWANEKGWGEVEDNYLPSKVLSAADALEVELYPPYDVPYEGESDEARAERAESRRKSEEGWRTLEAEQALERELEVSDEIREQERRHNANRG